MAIHVGRREFIVALSVATAWPLAWAQQPAMPVIGYCLPMIAELREFTVAGGLASYGTSRADLWRRSASYVAKIMGGEKPGDLPVEQPTRFELVISLKVAKMFGLDVSAMLLSRADEVIE